MRKRVLSMLLVFCMILTWLPASALAVDAAQPYSTPANTDASTVWDGSVADSYAGGSGTSGDPYLIATAEQLARVADQVNRGAESGKSYRLLNDIYLNDVSSVNIWDTVAPQNKWVPIGSASTLFSGVFDGASYSVRGLYISTADNYQGLFGSVTSSSPISNLSIDESYINGGNYVGGICGYSSSSLSNCHNGATVIGGSYVSGIVGGVGNPGGLFGGSVVNIENCSNAGKISGVSYVGGVLGNADTGSLNKCYNVGTVTGTNQVGGIAGRSVYSNYCWNAGDIIGSNYVGGILGEAAYFGMDSSSVSSCFNAGSVSGNNYVGGIYGVSHVHSSLYPCSVSNCYNVGSITGTGDYIGGITGRAAIHDNGGGFFGANKCSYTSCYNAGICAFGSGSNSNAIFNLGYGSATNLYYLEGCCGASYKNSWPSCVTEMSIIDMLRGNFVDTLNNGSKAWVQDIGVVNGGYPILAGIDYTVLIENGLTRKAPVLRCDLAVMDSVTFDALSDVYVFDNTTGALIAYVQSDGHATLSAPGTTFVKDTSITFYKSGYREFTCLYSDLDVSVDAICPTNSIYMNKDDAEPDDIEERALIGEHVDFARYKYQDLVDNYGFYNTVWDQEHGKRLWAFYLWEILGDVGEVASLKFDDLIIWADYYDVFLNDLILDQTGNELDSRFDDIAFKSYNEAYNQVTGNIVVEFMKFFAANEDFIEKDYAEIWSDRRVVKKSLDDLLSNKTYEMNEWELKLWETFFERVRWDTDLKAMIFKGAYLTSEVTSAINTISTTITDTIDFACNIANSYILSISATQINEEIFNLLEASAADMVSSRPDYANWFEENVLKYKSIATNTGSMMLYLVFEAGLDLANITYKGLFKDIVKNCAYKFVSESIGITVPQIKLLVAIYNGTYKLMNSLTKSSEAGEQYFIMNYIAPVERSLENVIEDVGTNLIAEPTSNNSDQFETAYNILRYTNKYLYSAAYNFGVYAKNKSDMEAATILKHMWTLANCHNKIIANRSKYINVACPTDVYLYNAAGELVVAIVDDLVVTYTDPYITVMNYDGEKSLMYPSDENYTIKIVAREDGIMDYSIIEVEDDEALRYIEFYDLDISSGQEFSGSIPEGFGINEVEYTLVTSAETIEANYDSDRNNSCADNHHSWGEWITKIEPTTENFGLRERLCAVCGKIESSSIQPQKVATYAVVFNANGGTGTMSPTTATENTPFTLPACAFTAPTRKQFKAWQINGTEYSPGETYTFTADTTVYALWEDVPVTTYSLTVTNGTGSGSYAAGVQVPIVADTAPTGKVFDKWTTSNGGTFADASSAGTTFTMPLDNVTVTATYKDITTPPAQTYSLTVTNGTGSGDYEAGAKVSIVANAAPEGKTFDKWTTNNGGIFADASSPSTTFTMPAGNVTVTATYKDAATPPVQTYSLMVTNGTGSGNYEVGTQVSIVANVAPEGKQFDKWATNSGGSFADASSASTTFTMPAGDVTVTATYKDITTPPVQTYSLTVTNGAGSGDYEAGTQVSIVANAAPEGKRFDKWTTNSGGSFADASDANTIFTMPAGDVTVTATYKNIVTPPVQTYSLTVTNGTGSGSYEAGTQVSIVADAAPAGKEFDQWTTNNEGTFADASSTSTTFTMPAGDVTVTATYKDTTTPPVQTYSLTVANGTGSGDYEAGTQVSIVANAAPEGKEFDQWTTNNGGAFADTSSASTIFTMPADNVTVVATYKDIETPPVPPVPEHAHSWSATWTSDVHGHWHNCTAENCTVTANDQKDGYAAHTSDGGKVTTAATTYQNGVRTYSCTVCGYVLGTETIPATGGNDRPGGGDWPSNGGGSSSSGYAISAPSRVTGGTVRVSPTRADRGTTVTITATPNSGYELDRLTVTETSGNELRLTGIGNGKYTFIMPGNAVTVEAVFEYKANPGPIQTWTNPFTDINVASWYYDAVRFVNESGLMNGITSSLFAPDANLTRAQFAQILYNKEGRSAVTGGRIFTDVASGTWYAPAITWAAERGIVGGYGNGMFGPNDNITREQLAVMLWRYAGSPAATDKELHFTDVDKANGYALEALRWAVENGIINGYGSGQLAPQGLATRAQVAQMLKNYLKR